MEVLGIDIGGTGIKGAPVDTQTGQLIAERFRLPTPQPATPEKVSATVAAVADHFGWQGQIGCGFPAVIQHGKTVTAANISKQWVGADGRALFEQVTGCAVTLGNDADVAGLAEMRFGAGKDRQGCVLIVTLGTGIGTALFIDGRLVPNIELGHIEVRGMDAEKWAAESARKREDLCWRQWAKRVDEVLGRLHAYLWPELIIIGGGVSKKHEKFLPYLNVPTEVVPAQLRNQAGMIGAALAAAADEVVRG